MNEAMTKLECRSSNTIQMRNDGSGRCANSFGRVPFIRHSSFVIRHFFRLALVLTLVLVVSCIPNRLRKANVDEVTEGMSKKQVESILGPPTNIDNKDFLIMKKTTYVYRQGNDTVTIVFKDDKLTDKQSTLTK
jgi:hypothetical protein